MLSRLTGKKVIPLVCGGIIGTGGLIGGLVTGIKGVGSCIDDYHWSRDFILSPASFVSIVFIGEFFAGFVEGALITATFPVLGPMYLHKKYLKNKIDTTKFFDKFTP